MSWQLLIGLSVLLYSVNGLLHRVMMKDEASDPYTQTIAFTGLVGFFAFIIAIFRGGLQTSFSTNQFFLFLPMVILGTFGNIFAFKGVKLIEASEHTILITSSKLWFIAGTLLILREPFSLKKIIGAIIVLIGVVVAQWRKGKFVFNIGAVYVLFSALFFASSDILSFLILRNFDATSLVVYFCILSTIALIIIRPGTMQKLSFYKKPRRAANILIVSANDTLASLFVFIAYQVGRNGLQIGPLGATQTIVTVILALIFLGETDNTFQKISGAATVVIGTILLL